MSGSEEALLVPARAGHADLLPGQQRRWRCSAVPDPTWHLSSSALHEVPAYALRAAFACAHLVQARMQTQHRRQRRRPGESTGDGSMSGGVVRTALVPCLRVGPCLAGNGSPARMTSGTAVYSVRTAEPRGHAP